MKLKTVVFMGLMGLSPITLAKSLLVEVQGQPYHLDLEINQRLQSGLPKETVDGIYSGVVQGHANSWVRASFIEGQWQGWISLDNTVYQFDSEQINIGSSPAISSQSRISFAKPLDGLANLGTCSIEGHNHQVVVAKALAPQTLPATYNSLCTQYGTSQVNGKNVCMAANIDFVFDSAFNDLYGSQASSQALDIINRVEGLYIDNFQIRFNTLSVSILGGDQIADSSSTSVLLRDASLKKVNNQFGFEQVQNALLHLVTGQTSTGNTVGEAWVGEACTNGFIAADGTGVGPVGVSRVIRESDNSANNSLTSVVIAHEIGHNFNAGHDGESGNGAACGAGFIMEAQVGNTSQFSSCSDAAIKNYIASVPDALVSSCLVNPSTVGSLPQVNLSPSLTNTTPTSGGSSGGGGALGAFSWGVLSLSLFAFVSRRRGLKAKKQ